MTKYIINKAWIIEAEDIEQALAKTIKQIPDAVRIDKQNEVKDTL